MGNFYLDDFHSIVLGYVVDDTPEVQNPGDAVRHLLKAYTSQNPALAERVRALKKVMPKKTKGMNDDE